MIKTLLELVSVFVVLGVGLPAKLLMLPMRIIGSIVKRKPARM